MPHEKNWLSTTNNVDGRKMRTINKQKLDISLSEEDLKELSVGRILDYVLEGIEICIYKEDG